MASGALCRVRGARNVGTGLGSSHSGDGIVPEGSKSAKGSRSEDRRRRLAAELRANLGKRKAQARARAAEASVSRDKERPNKA